MRITRQSWAAADEAQRETWAGEVLEQLPEGAVRVEDDALIDELLASGSTCAPAARERCFAGAITVRWPASS